jgi:hypothetical protein
MAIRQQYQHRYVNYPIGTRGYRHFIFLVLAIPVLLKLDSSDLHYTIQATSSFKEIHDLGFYRASNLRRMENLAALSRPTL